MKKSSLPRLLNNSAKKRRNTLNKQRFDIQQKLFSRFDKLNTIPNVSTNSIEIPRLWVPPICHYRNASIIDSERNQIHLQYLTQFVGGLLVNGSTGDGWALPQNQQLLVLKDTLDFMHERPNTKCPILIGCMQHSIDDKIEYLQACCAFLNEYYDGLDNMYNQSPFVGFTITAESNCNNYKTQQQGLEEILHTFKDYPFALYQLPQVTNSMIGIDVLTNLSSKFANVIMFKDSSGTDDIAKSQRSVDGIFMVRGAEGNQMSSLINANYGASGYNGLLLSTANNYPSQYEQLLRLLMSGNSDNFIKAANLSQTLSELIESTFDIVKDYDFSNAFTNSAKLVDFFIAYGDGIQLDNSELDLYVPKSIQGNAYDISDLEKVRNALRSADVINKGYMQGTRTWWNKAY